VNTPNLDRVQRHKDHPDEESQFTMVEDSTGHWVDIADVRAAYVKDLAAAVAAARADERQACFLAMRAAMRKRASQSADQEPKS
jgi:hypothetical protein